jgi:RimJ/RimL family protein N-acetyltransferase
MSFRNLLIFGKYWKYYEKNRVGTGMDTRIYLPINTMKITTQRLILREYEQDDWPAVLAYQSDPRYLRFYPWTGRTPEEAREFVGMFLNQQAEQPRRKFQLAVTLKSNHKLIGNCGIRMKTPDSHQGDIGYEFSPNYWGQGYATESVQAMVNFGFTQLGLHRIWSWCIADNRGSARVLEKLGMQLEARLQENESFKGRYWDTLVYGLLEPEWSEIQPKNKKISS